MSTITTITTITPKSLKHMGKTFSITSQTMTHRGKEVSTLWARLDVDHLATTSSNWLADTEPRFLGYHCSTVSYMVQGAEMVQVNVRTRIQEGRITTQAVAYRAVTGCEVRAKKWDSYKNAALALHQTLVNTQEQAQIAAETLDLAHQPLVKDFPQYTAR